MKLLYTLILFLLSCSTEPEVVHGCLDGQACNYNSSATIDNNTCEYMDNCDVCDNDPDNDCMQDCADAWGGDALADNCNVCDSDSTNDCVQDCAGTWGGSLVDDECGICGGDNSICVDCSGVPNGDALADMCDTCDNDSSNDCVQDCAGVWGGSAAYDDCITSSVCSGGTTGLIPYANCTDCNGDIFSSAYIDECGDCVGGFTGLDACVVPYSIALELISDGTIYSDLDAKSIIFQATLTEQSSGNPVSGQEIDFLYSNINNSQITDAYFQPIDLTTLSNGTFKTDLNDGGEFGELLITASFSDIISTTYTLTILPYYEAVATVSGWTDDPEIISGIDAATTESTRIWTQVLDAYGLPLKNVQIVFGVNEDVSNTQPNIGSFITDFISYTDDAGKTYVDYEAFPNTAGGNLNVTIDIVGDPDENNENHKEISITVNEPKFDYCLLLESAGGNNYSDLNNTTTLFEATLLNVFCAEGISSTTCCTDSTVISDGDPVASQTLQIDFTNTQYPVPLGEIELIDPLTDSNGKMNFEYLDNGETGTINISVSYTDVFGNSADEVTYSFTVYPVEQLVAILDVAAPEMIVITDETVIYETSIDVFAQDENGASVQNVNIEFFNDGEIGTLSSSNCATSINGLCEITLYSTQSNIGTAIIRACVSDSEGLCNTVEIIYCIEGNCP